MAGALRCCAALTMICCMATLAILFTGFTNIQPTEMAVTYNSITKEMGQEPIFEPGLSFVGPWVKVLKYPTTVNSIAFSPDGGEAGVLHARTSDGLPVVLAITFQYKLDPTRLLDLYYAFEKEHGHYEDIFLRVANHLVTEAATNFSAYKFFNDKMGIASEMRLILDEHFQRYLFASVESLQINEDDLPEIFKDAVVQAATEKQRITQTEHIVEAKKVTFETAIVVAEANANKTLAAAQGQVNNITQAGLADVEIIKTYVEAEKAAYTSVQKNMGLTPSQVTRYMWFDTLNGGGVNMDLEKDVSLLVGFTPGAAIGNQKRR